MPKIPQKIVLVIGAMKELAVRTAFYISVLNFIMISVTAYNTTIKHYLDIPFWLFVVILGTIVFMAMLFEYAIVYPSVVAFNSRQWYKHNNPLVKDIKEIKEELKKLREDLKNGGG